MVVSFIVREQPSSSENICGVGAVVTAVSRALALQKTSSVSNVDGVLKVDLSISGADDSEAQAKPYGIRTQTT